MENNLFTHPFFSEQDLLLPKPFFQEYYGDVSPVEINQNDLEKYRKLSLAEIRAMKIRGNQLDDLKLCIDKVLITILPMAGNRDITREIQNSIRLIGDLTFAKITDNPSSKSKEQLLFITI